MTVFFSELQHLNYEEQLNARRGKMAINYTKITL